jgi:predicted metal-dependent peptidase
MLNKSEIKKHFREAKEEIYMMTFLSFLIESVHFMYVDKPVEEFLGCIQFDFKTDELRLMVNKNIESVQLLMAIVTHELLHVTFAHNLINYDSYKKQLLNVAMDMEVNPFVTYWSKIKDMNFVCAKDLVENMIPPQTQSKNVKFTGYSGKLTLGDKAHWKNIYDYLMNTLPEDHPLNSEGGFGEEFIIIMGDGEGSGNGENEGEGEGEGDGESDKEGKPSNKPGKSGKGVVLVYDNKSMMNGEKASSYEKTKVVEIVEDALNKLEKHINENKINISKDKQNGQGNQMGDFILNHFDFRPKPVAVWKSMLKQVVFSTIPSFEIESTYKRLDRRLHSHSIRLPGVRQLFIPSIHVLVDTSGSMSSLVPSIITHLFNIGRILNGIQDLRLCDTRTRYTFKDITKHELNDLKWDSMSMWGGTHLSESMRESMKIQPDIFVIITDLELPYDDFDTINKISRKTKLIICTDKNKHSIESKEIKRKYEHVDILKTI